MKSILGFVKAKPLLAVVFGFMIILTFLIYPDVFKILYETEKDLGQNIFNGFFLKGVFL